MVLVVVVVVVVSINSGIIIIVVIIVVVPVRARQCTGGVCMCVMYDCMFVLKVMLCINVCSISPLAVCRTLSRVLPRQLFFVLSES